MGIDCVLDASALLALIGREPGAERVAAVAPVAALGAVNLTEVVSRLIDRGQALDMARREIVDLGLTVVALTPTLAYEAARLRPATRHRGLSLGDRACLALALREGAPAVTADRAWEGLDVGVEIILIR